MAKDRSHAGIHGNEEADNLAKKAALCPGNTCITVNSGQVAHMDHIWPSVQPPVAADGNLPPRIATPNLTRGVKANLPNKIHTGGTNMHGIHASLWTVASPEHLPHASNYFWQQASVPRWQKIQIHKARWVCLWNKKLAYLCKMPYGSNPHPPSSETCSISGLLFLAIYSES